MSETADGWHRCASCGIRFIPAPGHFRCIQCRIADTKRTLDSYPADQRARRATQTIAYARFLARERPVIVRFSEEDRARTACRRRIEEIEEARRLRRECADYEDAS